MRLAFGAGLLGSLDEAAKREWLVTDGLGGYAMGTVAGLRTRRYHGLLAVAAGGPGARMLGLVALDPVLVLGDRRVRLSTDEWADGTIDPRGHELLSSFELDRGVPRWRWQVGDVVVERELAMAHGRAVVGVVHRLLRSDRPVALELTALCTWRSVHGERFADGVPAVEPTTDGFVFERVYRVSGPSFTPGGDWYRGCVGARRAHAGSPTGRTSGPPGASAGGSSRESSSRSAAAAPFDGPLPPRGASPRRARGPRASRRTPGSWTTSHGSWSSRPTSS